MLALQSHFQELLNSFWHNGEITKEDLILSNDTIVELTNHRRNVMQQIMDRYKDWDKKYWCI